MVFSYSVRCKYYVMGFPRRAMQVRTTCDVTWCNNFWSHTVCMEQL